jgi:hypothetical protein
VCVCIPALIIRHANCLFSAPLCIDVWDCLALTYFSTLSHKRHAFWTKSYWTQNMCFDFLDNFFLKCFSFYDEVSEIWSYKNIGPQVKYPLFLSNLSETWIFSTDWRKMSKHQISWKSVQCESNCSTWTDRHDEVISSFSQFCTQA